MEPRCSFQSPESSLGRGGATLKELVREGLPAHRKPWQGLGRRATGEASGLSSEIIGFITFFAPCLFLPPLCSPEHNLICYDLEFYKLHGSVDRLLFLYWSQQGSLCVPECRLLLLILSFFWLYLGSICCCPLSSLKELLSSCLVLFHPPSTCSC